MPYLALCCCCLVVLAFKNTYGWARAEVLGALVNAVFLVALCFSITVESLKRFYEPEDIHDPQERQIGLASFSYTHFDEHGTTQNLISSHLVYTYRHTDKLTHFCVPKF